MNNVYSREEFGKRKAELYDELNELIPQLNEVDMMNELIDEHIDELYDKLEVIKNKIDKKLFITSRGVDVSLILIYYKLFEIYIDFLKNSLMYAPSLLTTSFYAFLTLIVGGCAYKSSDIFSFLGYLILGEKVCRNQLLDQGDISAEILAYETVKTEIINQREDIVEKLDRLSGELTELQNSVINSSIEKDSFDDENNKPKVFKKEK